MPTMGLQKPGTKIKNGVSTLLKEIEQNSTYSASEDYWERPINASYISIDEQLHFT